MSRPPRASATIISTSWCSSFVTGGYGTSMPRPSSATIASAGLVKNIGCPRSTAAPISLAWSA
jgi:hypothetical protein